MTYKTFEEVLQQLPFFKQIEWVDNIQQEMQCLLPASCLIALRCSLENHKLVFLVENPLMIRYLTGYIEYLQPVLDKYKLATPKILVKPR